MCLTFVLLCLSVTHYAKYQSFCALVFLCLCVYLYMFCDLSSCTGIFLQVGLAGSLASMCMERRFGAGESQFILYTLQQV